MAYRGGDGETDGLSIAPASNKSNLASCSEIRFLLPSPPCFETFQVAFLGECTASGQSDSRHREKSLTKGTFKCSSPWNPLQYIGPTSFGNATQSDIHSFKHMANKILCPCVLPSSEQWRQALPFLFSYFIERQVKLTLLLICL